MADVRSNAAFEAIAPTEEGLSRAGQLLRSGVCVAFPTETVYGLGANALDEAAVLSIFKHKGRPLTDPLIVHTNSASAARALLELDDRTSKLFEALAAEFWPGPLTLVGRAHASIPAVVTARTGLVGVRVPAHPLARALIEVAQVPVAAPSANRFGHVSPTKAAHVIADLGDKPIGVLMADSADTGGISCGIGIESTVVKIDASEAAHAPRLVVYRRGGVSVQQLQAALLKHSFSDVDISFNVMHSTEKVGAAAAVERGAEAPGMLLTHYAPDVTTYMVVSRSTDSDSGLGMSSCVIVDFGGQLADLKPCVLAYRDLSPPADVLEARAQVFDALRWAEQVPDASAVLLMDPAVAASGQEHVDALRDRMYRAASGREISVSPATS